MVLDGLAGVCEGFNEAEAIKPRNRYGIMESCRPARRFNEAEAIKPRNLRPAQSVSFFTQGFNEAEAIKPRNLTWPNMTFRSCRVLQ